MFQIQDFKDKSLIFYKNSVQQIGSGDSAVENNNINIITLSSNPAESLYHTLRQVYSPLLTAVSEPMWNTYNHQNIIIVL